jgi:hypothetical protein
MLFLHCQVMVGNIFFVQGDLGTKICTSWFVLMVKINIFIASLRGIGLTHPNWSPDNERIAFSSN